VVIRSVTWGYVVERAILLDHRVLERLIYRHPVININGEEIGSSEVFRSADAVTILVADGKPEIDNFGDLFEG
jgi:hypothetical protein